MMENESTHGSSDSTPYLKRGTYWTYDQVFVKSAKIMNHLNKSGQAGVFGVQLHPKNTPTANLKVHKIMLHSIQIFYPRT
jgi:hypothetical protein